MRGLRIVAAAVLGALAGGAVTLALPLEDPRPTVRPPPPADVVGGASIRTLLAWTPGGLPSGYAEAVRGLRAVRAAAEVRSGTAWLTGWRGVGLPAETTPAGLAFPVEVAAVRPASYRRFVPPAERAAIEALAHGGALVSRGAAALRGIGPGSRLRFGPFAVQVLGVVDDELVGAHEVVVSFHTGARLGIARSRYLLVAPRPETERRVVEEGLRRSLPAGTRVRVRGPGETPVFRHGDAVLPSLRLKELFGEFAAAPLPGGMLRIDPRWAARHIRTASVPVLGRVTCHRAIVPALRSALRELERRGLDDLIDPGDYGGCYSPRFIARSPGAGISHHAWGIAFDVNVTQNPLGGEPRMDPRIVDVFERRGFAWGGRWLVPDGMHFEFLRFAEGD